MGPSVGLVERRSSRLAHLVSPYDVSPAPDEDEQRPPTGAADVDDAHGASDPPSAAEGVGGGGAAEIEAHARVEAERIRRAAHDEAEETVRAAREARAQAEEYASDTRLAVEAYASAHRREAEREAREIVAAAEAEAQAIRDTAETSARRLDEEARERRAELAAENRVLEERRRRTLDDLREVAAQLEDMFDEPARARDDTAPAPDDDASGTLADALSLRRRR